MTTSLIGIAIICLATADLRLAIWIAVLWLCGHSVVNDVHEESDYNDRHRWVPRKW